MTERVAGIGGVFLRADDPEALTEWSRTRLGIEGPPEEGGQRPWR